MQTATATHNLEMAIATATPTTIVAEVAEKLWKVDRVIDTDAMFI